VLCRVSGPVPIKFASQQFLLQLLLLLLLKLSLHDLARIATMTTTICAILGHINSRPATLEAFCMPAAKIPYYLSD